MKDIDWVMLFVFVCIVLAGAGVNVEAATDEVDLSTISWRTSSGGLCSATATQQGIYTSRHCVEVVKPGTTVPDIVKLSEEIVSPALPVCETPTEAGHPVTLEGWPGAFDGTARMRVEYIVIITDTDTDELLIDGIVMPGMSGGAVIDTARQCITAIISALTVIDSTGYSYSRAQIIRD